MHLQEATSRLGDDGRLWVTWEISNIMAQGYGWKVEAVGPNGFSRQALGGTISMWAAKRKVRRYIKQWRKEVRHG